MFPLLLSQASSWALDLRKPSQHSASHLSDRCLPPKQWIITVCQAAPTWSGLQPSCFCSLSWLGTRSLPTKHLFLGMARRCFVSVRLSLCLCLSFPTTFLFFISFSLLLFPFSVLLTQTPQSNEQADYVREKREQKKREKDVLPPGE